VLRQRHAGAAAAKHQLAARSDAAEQRLGGIGNRFGESFGRL